MAGNNIQPTGCCGPSRSISSLAPEAEGRMKERSAAIETAEERFLSDGN